MSMVFAILFCACVVIGGVLICATVIMKVVESFKVQKK